MPNHEEQSRLANDSGQHARQRRPRRQRRLRGLPASKLIQAAVEGGFLATYSQASLNHLKGLMESSTPTIRNKEGGHGAGQAVRDVPSHLATFQLHQTAAVILFLAQQDAAVE
jgi:hypothetical protein